jgi:hypothetical protein
MDAHAFDLTTIQTEKEKTKAKQTRQSHKLYIPKPVDPKELDELHLHQLEQIHFNGVMSTDQLFILDGADDLRTQDRERRHLGYLFHSGHLIRLKPTTRKNAPILHRCSPKGGRVLHAAGRIDRQKIPRNIKNDAQNYYWKHTVMRGDLRVRLTRLLRERHLPVPEYQGVTSIDLN